MIRFLLQRPIAVLMVFTACFILGLTTYFPLPVSLLPDIAIPEITVQVSGANTSARELENTVIKPVRQQLMQVAGLQDIQSETRNGAGTIRLKFDFGTNTDLAFIEVNEKIDIAMNYLPREVKRPRVVKASATDIPVFYLNLTMKSDSAYEKMNEAGFLKLCEFAETVIKRRIEQLPEVTMVDMTGKVGRQLQIVPDMKLLTISDISIQDIENALAANNIEPGSMIVRDGYYEYYIKFSTLLRTEEDVKNIYIRKGARMFQLKELAKVGIVPEKESGISLANGKRAVTLAVIKQADENMDKMKAALKGVTDHFSSIYPDIEFSISRNQTELLDYTTSNLKQNLMLGFFFIFLVAVMFLGDVKSPLVIGLSLVVSIVISFVFFYLFHISLNIISLSGLILALGMMIDSSIIVTENIAQYRALGNSLEESCVKGTSEVITPMLSSTFTTISVFIPLVFLSGIAGAIFFDQAFAVTVGLLVSYFTGIMLLPVLYKLVYSLPEIKLKRFNFKINNPIKAHTLDRFYDAGVDFVFRHKKSSIIVVLITFPICALMFYQIPKTRMPEIDQNELIAHIEWNEPIHVEENNNRVNELLKQADRLKAKHTAYIGRQQFILKRDNEMSVSEAEVYLRTGHSDEIAPLQQALAEWIEQSYPDAQVSFSPPETVFEKLFDTGEAEVVAELSAHTAKELPDVGSIRVVEDKIIRESGETPVGVAFDNQLNLMIDHSKLQLYRVDYNEVYRLLKTVFKENEVATLRSFEQYLPINVAGEERTVGEVLQQTMVRTRDNERGEYQYIPLKSLIKVTPGEDLKSIIAGKNGEYIPIRFYGASEPERLMAQIKTSVSEVTANNQSKTPLWNVDFSGSFFSNRKMMNELLVILFISILLMYFILAAQFESFLQPLIVLLEIPIDVAASLVVLWICGHSLNLMSAIGIVVTCGIIINDSILKIDAINELRKTGVPLLESIHEAGRRRLRPIVMTSLTTILGMVPLLFSFDMGSELQKPLSIAMISAMVIGTAVSLFFIPLVYWYIYRKSDLIKMQQL